MEQKNKRSDTKLRTARLQITQQQKEEARNCAQERRLTQIEDNPYQYLVDQVLPMVKKIIPMGYQQRQTTEEWDAMQILNALQYNWELLPQLPKELQFPKSIIATLKSFRNAWAHQRPLTQTDQSRVTDAVLSILKAFRLDTKEYEEVRRRIIQQIT